MELVREAGRIDRYLVELTPLADSLDDIQALVARARTATEELSREGTPVRLVRSLFLPDDGSLLLLLEGGSGWVAEEAGRRAAAGTQQVSEATRLASRRTVRRDRR
jgi:hypothetical protein